MALGLTIGLARLDAHAAAPEPAEVWLTSKGEQPGGAGSREDPWRVPTADAFAERMRGIAAGTVIHLGPGVFDTYGWGAPDHQGFEVRTGWTVAGAGRDKTTLRLLGCMADPKPGSGIGRVLFSGWGAGVENVVIRDLTIDCNARGVQSRMKRDNISLEAIRLMGRELRIEHVKVVHAIGGRDISVATPEAFLIALSPRDEKTDATGFFVEDCEVSQFGGGQCTAICVLGAGGKNGVTGAFRRNKVLMQGGPGEYAFSTYGARDFIIEQNVTVQATRVFNWDTAAPGHGILIRSNQFLQCTGWAMNLGGGKDSTIEKNLFELSNSHTVGVQISAANALFPGAGAWTIRSNVFRALGGTPVAFRFFNGQPVDGCVFEGNTVDRRLLIDKSARSLKSWKNNVNERGRRIPMDTSTR